MEGGPCPRRAGRGRGLLGKSEATEPAEVAAQGPGQGGDQRRPVMPPGDCRARPGPLWPQRCGPWITWPKHLHHSRSWCPRAHPGHLTPCQADPAGQGRGLGRIHRRGMRRGGQAPGTVRWAGGSPWNPAALPAHAPGTGVQRGTGRRRLAGSG